MPLFRIRLFMLYQAPHSRALSPACSALVSPFPKFLRVFSRSFLKIQWEKEKLLLTSNFSFSHSVLYLFGELSAIIIKVEIVIWKVCRFGRVWNSSFRKGLNLKSIWDSPKFVVLQWLNLARVAQWWACRTHDLVVVSSIPGWGELPFRRIFASHLSRSMWEK